MEHLNCFQEMGPPISPQAALQPCLPWIKSILEGEGFYFVGYKNCNGGGADYKILEVIK